jgi:hypothetical protein
MHIAFSLRRRRFLIIAPKALEIFKMQITEILQRTSEMQEKNAVLLLHEGLFWRAYEQGALALCEYVHPFKVTTRYYKGICQWVSYVGFPDASLRKWTEGRTQCGETGNQSLCIALSPAESQHINACFGEWKSQQVTKAKAESQNTVCDECHEPHAYTSIGSRAGNVGTVIMRLRTFPLESSTPLGCMNFVAELKALLQNDNRTE